MIQNAHVTPILPVVDLSRATGFYRDQLGLKDLGDEAGTTSWRPGRARRSA